jgi:hypothetical protein
MAAGNVRMLQHSGENFLGECLKFLQEKKLLDKQTLFMSILTKEEGLNDYRTNEQELSKHKCLYTFLLIFNFNLFSNLH